MTLLCLQETWLNNKKFELDKRLISVLNNRPDGYGGIAIFVKNRITYKQIIFPAMEANEIIGITINIENKIYNLINMYINSRVNNLNLKKDFDSITTVIQNVIICGLSVRAPVANFCALALARGLPQMRPGAFLRLGAN